MLQKRWIILGLAAAMLLAACAPAGAATTEEPPASEEMMEDENTPAEEAMDDEDEMMDEQGMTTFTLRIENISAAPEFFASGIFNTPTGADAPGPLAPGQAYSFAFSAPPGARLSFATMFVQSNDLFYAPAPQGLALYDENGPPRSADLTAEIMLWDAGTEVNQEPGSGTDQAPRQAGPNTGAAEDGPVQLVEDMYTYPQVADHIQVTLRSLGDGRFELTLANIADDASLLLAPGVWVVSNQPDALFQAGALDRGGGLEALAEDGNPAPLAESLSARSGLTVLLAPGVWVVFTEGVPLFEAGAADRGMGLEALAEDGDPSALNAALAEYMGVKSHGIFNTPMGAADPGPLAPGGAYEFTFTADPGDRLTFASMFVQSNDLFYAPDPAGLALIDESGAPLEGDITDLVLLWDAGTEVNQEPGVGAHQAPRQSGPNSGAPENDPVLPVEDMYSYPEMAIRVTISVDGR